MSVQGSVQREHQPSVTSGNPHVANANLLGDGEAQVRAVLWVEIKEGNYKCDLGVGCRIHRKDKAGTCELLFRYKLQIDHKGGVGLWSLNIC